MNAEDARLLLTKTGPTSRRNTTQKQLITHIQKIIRRNPFL